MGWIRSQYFFTFAAIGALLPYLPVFLEARGLSENQIGYVFAAMAGTGLLSPVIVTLMADLKVTNRKLLGVLLGISAGVAAMMASLESYWALLVAAAVYQLATQPKNPLQDVLYFREYDKQKTEGHVPPLYHRIRVWGTIGFIVPSIILYKLLDDGQDVAIAIFLVAALNGIAMLNTFMLPAHKETADGEVRSADDEPDDSDALRTDSGEAADDQSPGLRVHAHRRRRRSIPTWTAARTLFSGTLLPFCIAMFLGHLVSAIYYTFYPLYLTNVVDVEEKWVGPIVSLGVVLEIGFMLGYGWLIRHLGLRGLVLLGSSALLVRMSLLAMFPTASIAIATQTLHGLTVLLLHVVPPLWLNRHAAADNRNSIQGLFVMLIWGGGRIAGNLLGGMIGETSLIAAFGWAAGLAVVMVLLVVAFFPRETEAQEEATRNSERAEAAAAPARSS